MLTVFYFDQEVFSDDSLNIPLTNSAILETWLQYGCLAICQDHSINIKEAVKNIHPKYKQKWITALTSQSYKKTRVAIEQPLLSSLKSLDEFKDIFFSKNVTTGIIISEYDELFDPKIITIGNTNLEIVTPSNINESVNFKNSIYISQKDITSNEKYSDIWDKRFSALAEQTSVVTILDRYMALNIESDYKKGLKTSIERLIESLYKHGKQYTIDIYSACDFPEKNINCTEFKEYIDNTLKKKPYFSESKFEIKFAVCKDNIFKSEAHDRMICFDNHVIQIGKGMDIFRENMIQNNTFTIKARNSSSFDEIYKELIKNREWTYKP